MNTLIDTILSKVETVTNRSNRVLAIADLLLDRVASKDVAAASYYEYRNWTACWTFNPCASHKMKEARERRLCTAPGNCGAWGPAAYSICC